MLAKLSGNLLRPPAGVTLDRNHKIASPGVKCHYPIERSFSAALVEYPLQHYQVEFYWDRSNHQERYWDHLGEKVNFIRHATGAVAPLEERGQTLSWYGAAFRRDYPSSNPVELFPVADLLVNRIRFAVARQDSGHILLGVPDSLREMEQPRDYLAQWRSGVLEVCRLKFCLELRDGKWSPLSACRPEQQDQNLLPDLKWAIAGLPIIREHQALADWWRNDDDARHVVQCAPVNGQYCPRYEVVQLLRRGGDRCSPLEVDLNRYGQPSTVLAALENVGYHHNPDGLSFPGEYQFMAEGRIKMLPLAARYPAGILGINEKGNLVYYSGKGDPDALGYPAMTIDAQAHFAAPSMKYGWLMCEGMDPPARWRPHADLPAGAFPVRGVPGQGRLAAVLAIFEQ